MKSLVIFEASDHVENGFDEPAKPEEKRSPESWFIIDPALSDDTSVPDLEPV